MCYYVSFKKAYAIRIFARYYMIRKKLNQIFLPPSLPPPSSAVSVLKQHFIQQKKNNISTLLWQISTFKFKFSN